MVRIIPAIDIRGGNVVRLIQGDYAREQRYGNDPVAVAQEWASCGAPLLHIVDLDGAREGTPQHLPLLKKLTQAVAIPIEFGGGLRTAQAVAEVCAAGVRRVVIGTKALDETFMRQLIAVHGPDTIVVGIDAVGGIVKTEGWLKDSGSTIEALCEKIIHCGVRHVIVTDISRDGTLAGPHLDTLRRVLAFPELQVVASGGVGSLEDIRTLLALKSAQLFGIIVGKALYDGKVSLVEALRLVSGDV